MECEPLVLGPTRELGHQPSAMGNRPSSQRRELGRASQSNQPKTHQRSTAIPRIHPRPEMINNRLQAHLRGVELPHLRHVWKGINRDHQSEMNYRIPELVAQMGLEQLDEAEGQLMYLAQIVQDAEDRREGIS